MSSKGNGKTPDEDDETIIRVDIIHGGRFISENSYLGGEIVSSENIDCIWFQFDELASFIKDIGYDRVLKYAFRIRGEVEGYIFFHDHESYNKAIFDHIDLDKKLLKIYVECLEGDNEIGNKTVLEKGKAVANSLDFEGAERVNLLDVDFQDDESDVYVVSEYESSCDSPCSLDSDEEIGYSRSKKGVNKKIYRPNVDHSTFTFEIGMKFKDLNECKRGVRNWALANGYNIKWKKSELKRIEAVCEGDCPFMLFASKMKHEDTFIVKSLLDKHTCVRKSYNRQANSDWLAEIIAPIIKRHANYQAKDMMHDVQMKYGINVNLDLCYVAKKKALEELWGSFESHYSRLRPYVEHLQHSDREGRFLLLSYLNSDDKPVFQRVYQRVYIGFSALRKGFLVGCRRCICFDACFIKTAIGGAILAAVSKDCNGKMWPISWAVVEKEIEESWTWFFNHLFEDLNISDGLGWTFMSDKHKGIINSICKLAPHAEHRHCARHVYANWKKQFAGKKYKELFWAAVKASNPTKYNANVAKLKADSNEAYTQFEQRDPTKFCKALISTSSRTDIIDNNICESFNSYILKFRDLPIIDMLEKIRVTLMSRMPEILKKLESSSTILCPDVIKKLGKLQEQARHCIVTPAMDKKFEVRANDESVIVDLSEQFCTCRLWGLTGIPCKHVIACINHAREDPVRYVDKFYQKSNCMAAYRHYLCPILGPESWPIVDAPLLLPPPFIKQSGRPKKARRRSADEEPRQGKLKLSKEGFRVACTQCKTFGHNVRTCKVPVNETNTEPTIRRPVGRPQKQPSTTQKTITSHIERREMIKARQGFGVLTGETGNIYVRPPGARHTTVHRRRDEGGSKSSQVIDQSTPLSS